jgi:homoserine dehydrogenase
MRTQRLLLNGLGNVGRRFVQLLRERSDLLEERFGLRFLLVGAADSSGAIFDAAGLDLDTLLRTKGEGGRLADVPGAVPGQAITCLTEHHGADQVLEAAPTNLWNGQPGLDVALEALRRRIPVVMASKGPLVLAFPELAALSDWSDPALPALRFSGAVGGCLPSVNLGRRDLAGCRISSLQGVLNLSTGIYLDRMAQGLELEEVIVEAQAAGLAEADPGLDVDGLDLAAKLCILSHAVLGHPVRLSEIPCQGLRDLSPREVQAARARGERILLLARAEAEADGYWLNVAPECLPADHPFFALPVGASALLIDSDIQGRQILINEGQGPMGTAAAMLRDAIDIGLTR